MAQAKPVLKIYSLNQPGMYTEWRSILGDKYSHALPFDYALTDSLEEASVVAWDGVLSLKQMRLQDEILMALSKGKIFLRMGEAQTLFENHPLVKIASPKEMTIVELTGWSVLPEEILHALESCYQKINHV